MLSLVLRSDSTNGRRKTSLHACQERPHREQYQTQFLDVTRRFEPQMHRPPPGLRRPRRLMSDRARRSLQVAACVSILTFPVAAQAKPNITVDTLGRSLQITFVAPRLTSRDYKYFVRYETVRQEGCSWKSTSLGRHGSPGQTVALSLGPNSRQGRVFCPGPGKVTVFMQRAQGGFIPKDATSSTFKLVGSVRYVIE